MSNVWGMRVSGNKKGFLPIYHSNTILDIILRPEESHAHFIQLVNGSFPGALIEENISFNAPWKSHVEDVISIYNARGTEEQPILIRKNKIFGAYPRQPATDGYSGGGIIVDGNGKSDRRYSFGKHRH